MLMQISWLLPVEPSVYAADVKNVTFPVFEECPICKSLVRLQRHGFYPRYAVVWGIAYLIKICRYLCPSCQRTVSLLPLFLFCHFQHDRESILACLRAFFSGKKPPGAFSRQLVSFWRRRFITNLPAILRPQGEGVALRLAWRRERESHKGSGTVIILAK